MRHADCPNLAKARPLAASNRACIGTVETETGQNAANFGEYFELEKKSSPSLWSKVDLSRV